MIHTGWGKINTQADKKARLKIAGHFKPYNCPNVTKGKELHSTYCTHVIVNIKITT